MLDATRDVVSIILMLLAIVFMVGIVVAGYLIYKKILRIISTVQETVAQAKSTVETISQGIVMPLAKGAALGAVAAKVLSMVKGLVGDDKETSTKDGKSTDNISI